jgi:tagaturonate reductase
MASEMNDEKRVPVRVLQFGEGNFLRAFMDWMLQAMREAGAFDGSVAVSKTIPGPFAPDFAARHASYTVVVRGKEGERVSVDRKRVEVISKLVNPYEDFDGYLAAVSDPDLKVITSNTTEAGIAMRDAESRDDRPAPSYPGKLAQGLRARYLALGGTRESALLVMPCELIEKNGQTLRDYVLEHARRWYADPGFERWLTEDCSFYDTLVDRIVSGYDAAARESLKKDEGVDDPLIVVTEPYYIFVIQGAPREDILPFRKSGLNVVWTEDLTPYRTLKVRILNGGHTFLARSGLGLGLPTVKSGLDHPVLGPALRQLMEREIVPSLDRPEAEARAYCAKILDRYANPYLEHKLESIALNSASKWRTRVEPTLVAYAGKRGRVPALVAYSMAALIQRYASGAKVQDDAAVLAGFAKVAPRAASDPRAAARAALADETIWGGALPEVPGFADAVAERFADIRARGPEAALSAALEDSRAAERLGRPTP